MFECGGIRPALLHLEYEEEKGYGGRQFLPAKSWVSLPYNVMNKKIILFVCMLVLLALSLVAYSVSKITQTQVTNDISLKKIEDCKTIYWEETMDVYGTCTQTNIVTICDDEPLNTTCHTEDRSYDYRCKTGTNTIPKSREECKDKEMQLTIDKLTGIEEYSLNYAEWGKCSYTTEQDTLIITCDSKTDGNNDGICKPGESCIQFRVTKDSIQRFEKNSRYDWIENDETFFLEKLELEEVPK